MDFLIPLLNPNEPAAPQIRAAEEAYVGRRARLSAGTTLWATVGNKPQARFKARKTRNVTIKGVSFANKNTITFIWRERNRTFFADGRELRLLPEEAQLQPGRLRNSLLAA